MLMIYTITMALSVTVHQYGAPHFAITCTRTIC